MQHFYRLAQDQTPDTQERMLEGAINALDLPANEKLKLLENLKAALSRSQGKDFPRRARGDDGLFAYDVKPRYLSRVQIETRKGFGRNWSSPIYREMLNRLRSAR